MSGGGKGDRGYRRKPFRHRDQAPKGSGGRDQVRRPEPQQLQKPINNKFSANPDRPQWIPPVLPNKPLPVPDCPYCGKPIKDLAVAISDKNTGQAVHFDCIVSRISQIENLEQGDIISYIGGGRFGIVNYGSSPGGQGFVIKKILEWEIKENRAEWRQTVSDHYSVT